MKLGSDEAIVIFPIDPPSFESDIYYVDLVKKQVVGNPDYEPIPVRNLAVELDAVKERVKKLEQKEIKPV